MKRSTFAIIGTIAGGAVVTLASLWPTSAFADGGVYDIQVSNRKGFKEATTQDGAIVSYIGDSNLTFGASGSGTFNSFVRLQGSPQAESRKSSSWWNAP